MCQIKHFRGLYPHRRLLVPWWGDRITQSQQIKGRPSLSDTSNRILTSVSAQETKSKTWHEQGMHEIHKPCDTYGKHPTSPVIKETHVKYHFLFITAGKVFFKENTKYSDRECKTGIFTCHWWECNLQCQYFRYLYYRLLVRNSKGLPSGETEPKKVLDLEQQKG